MQACKYLMVYALLLILSPARAEGPEPVVFTASYKLYSGDLEIAKMERRMEKLKDNEYIYRSITHTVGLVAMFHKDTITEESHWRLVDQQIHPLDYSYLRTRKNKNRKVDIHFDWENHLTKNRINEQSLEMPLQPGTLDKLLYQYAIMHDLGNHREFPIIYHIVDSRKMKTYHFERLKDETIHTSLGDLDTIKIQSTTPEDGTSLTIWCAPQYNHLPVKVEHMEDGRVTTAVIEILTGLP